MLLIKFLKVGLNYAAGLPVNRLVTFKILSLVLSILWRRRYRYTLLAVRNDWINVFPLYLSNRITFTLKRFVFPVVFLKMLNRFIKVRLAY